MFGNSSDIKDYMFGSELIMTTVLTLGACSILIMLLMIFADLSRIQNIYSIASLCILVATYGIFKLPFIAETVVIPIVKATICTLSGVGYFYVISLTILNYKAGKKFLSMIAFVLYTYNIGYLFVTFIGGI